MKFVFLSLAFFVLPFSSHSQFLKKIYAWSESPFVKNYFIKNDRLHSSKKNEKILYWSKLGEVTIYFLENGLQFKREIVLKKPTTPDRLIFTENYRSTQPKETQVWNIKFKSNDKTHSSIEPKSKNKFTYNHAENINKLSQKTIKSFCYDTLVYSNLWPKIDLRLYFPEKGGLKYDILLHPGSNVDDIRFIYENIFDLTLNESGDLDINTEMGIIKDKSPESEDLITKKEINCAFIINENEVGFHLNDYNKKSEIIIDPWIWTTTFTNPNHPFDIEHDNLGNVYIYSAWTNNHEIQKYNSNGMLQWTYQTTYGHYGDLGVSKLTGDIFIVNGFDPSAGFFPGILVKKIDSQGNFVNQYQGDSIGDFNEAWRCLYDEKSDNLIIGAGGFMTPPSQAGYINSSLNTLNEVNILNSSFVWNDVTSMALDPDGSSAYFLIAETTYDPFYGNVMLKVPLPNLTPTNWLVQSNHSFMEVASIPYYNSGTAAKTNGYNGMTCGPCYLYSFDGNTIKQWDKLDGRFIKQVKLGLSEFQSGGIDVDTCGNIYVGAGNEIKVFNNILELVGSFHLPNTCYDIIHNQNNKIYACGVSFVTEISTSNFSCEVYYSPDCNQDCELLIDMPNIFTPNNDNKNEMFLPIKTECIKTASILIYNRWGKELYKSKDLQKGWNGKINSNHLAPDGTYYWVINYTDRNENRSTLKGFVTLIR